MTTAQPTVTQELTTALDALDTIITTAAPADVSVHQQAQAAIVRALDTIQHLRCEAVAQLDRL